MKNSFFYKRKINNVKERERNEELTPNVKKIVIVMTITLFLIYFTILTLGKKQNNPTMDQRNLRWN